MPLLLQELKPKKGLEPKLVFLGEQGAGNESFLPLSRPELNIVQLPPKDHHHIIPIISAIRLQGAAKISKKKYMLVRNSKLLYQARFLLQGYVLDILSLNFKLSLIGLGKWVEVSACLIINLVQFGHARLLGYHRSNRNITQLGGQSSQSSHNTEFV